MQFQQPTNAKVKVMKNFTYTKNMKVSKLFFSMKLNAMFSSIKFLSFATILVISNFAWGQNISNYTFSNNISTTLADLSSGSTALLTGNQDDNATVVTSIGFDFFYGGVRYNFFSANSNGQFQLHTTSGASAIGTTGITGYTASTPILFPMSGDNEVNGGIKYKVIGSAPNRTLVIEWTSFYAYYTNLSNAGNMQAWLEESTGKISYVYGQIYNSSSATVSRAIALSFGNTLSTAGYVTVGASPTFTASASLTSNTFAVGSGTATGSPLIANLGTSSTSARRAYIFTPPSPASMASPTSLSFTSVTTSGMTLNWVASSPTTKVVKYAIYNSTDNVNFTYVSTVNVGTNTYAATGLSISTLYYWKVYPLSEGALGTALSGSQSTAGVTTYYWTGTATAEFNTAATWNTAANGSGSARSSALSTDILIIDGAGTTAGTAITAGTINANTTVGQLKITSNTACTLRSAGTAQRVLTISGGSGGDDFVITSGSSLNLTNTTAANTISIIFSGTGTTGDISGTLTVAGTSATASSANSFLTTGGTGTIVTVSSTGIINNTATTNITTNGNVTGSAATLVFANGSQYNVSGATTAAPWIPLATWGATSNLTISGLTTNTTTPTNNVQSFGNFNYNCPLATATLNFWAGATTAIIQGNLTITATNTGKFRALSGGTLTVNGNLNVNGGTFETFGGVGTFNVLGNINLAGGTLNVAAGAGTTNLKGNFTQTGGTLTQTTNTGKLSFNGTVAQTFTPTTHTSTDLVVEINNSLGVTLSGALNLFKLTLTSGKITTGSNIITIINTATTGISGGSSTSYVNGILARTLLANATGTAAVYTFPVGKGSYNPFEIVNPTTGATTPVIRAEVFDANCGGSAGTNMCSLYSSRYWAASVVSGNFTSSFIKLTDANVVSTSAIASSGTLTGAYNIVGSTTPTIVASTSVQSTTTAATSIPGFFAIGTVGGTPTITAGTLTSFGASVCINTTTSYNSFTVSGSALTGNLTVNDLTGFTYCETTGGTYTSTLTLTPGTCGALSSTTVYVKFTPTAVQSYNGNIVLSGGGATSVNVAAVGSGVNTASTATSGASSAITSSTATVAGSYVANCQTITAYGIVYSTTNGFANGTGTQVASTNQSSGSFTSALTGLSANTTYYYKAYATYGATTVWGTQSSFTTLCTGSSLPYTEGFNVGATTSSSASCWSQNNVSGSIPVYQVINTPAAGFYSPVPANYNGTGMVGYPSYYNTASTRLVSPALVTTGVSSVDVEFQWFQGTEGGAYSYQTEGVTVQYSTNGSTWTTVGSQILRYNTTTGWTLKSITLPAGAANVATLYIGFLFNGLEGYDMYLDNVDIHATPNCTSQPTALTSSAISSTTATISWTAASSAPTNGYEYYLSTSSTAPTAGTTATGSVAAGVVTKALTSLTASTPYYFWVRSNCNGTDKSNWAGSGTFTTACAAISSFPWTETFDVSSTSQSCWSVIDGNADSDLWNMDGTLIPRSGQSAQLYTDYNSTNQDYLITPQINLGSTPKQIRFWVRHYDNTEPDNLRVKLSTTGNTIASFTNNLLTLSTTQITTTYTEYTVSLESYTGNVYVAFAREDAPANGWYISIDDVTIELIPACAAPTAQPTSLVLTPTNTTVSGSFTLSSSASNYLVVRTTTSSAPTSPVNTTTYTAGTSALGGVIVSSTTGNTFTDNSLSIGTTYWYWVYGYNATTCTGGPIYRTTSPLTGSTTTLSYKNWIGAGVAGGTGGTDFNTAANWNPTGVPGSTDDLTITTTTTATILMSANATVGSLAITNNRITGPVTLILDVQTRTLTVNNTFSQNLGASGNANTVCELRIGNGGSVVINGDASFGTTGSTAGFVAINGSGLAATSGNLTFKGNVVFGDAYGNTSSTAFINAVYFDGTSQSITTAPSYSVAFTANTIQIGNANTPTVTLNGPNNMLCKGTSAALRINTNSTLDLKTFYWSKNIIDYGAGGTFTMLSGALLKLGSGTTLTSSNVTGSNFPSNFTSAISLASTSTVEYNSLTSVNQTIYQGATYGNLTLTNGTGSGTTTKTAGGALTIAGNLLINPNSTFAAGASLSHNVAGNWVNNGTFTQGTSTVIFNGTGASTIGGTGANSFYNLTMNKGTATAVTTLATGLNTVTNQLNLTSGILDIAAYDLDMGSLTVSGGTTSSSYVKTSSTGVLKRNVGASDVLFPVGNSAYNPATINNSGTSDKFSVRVIDNVTNNGTGVGTLTSKAVVNRTWMVDEAVVGGSNASFRLNWNSDEGINGFNQATAFMAHYESASSMWDNIGGTVSNGYVTTTGITSFSPFTVSSDGSFAPLPIELISFQSNCANNNTVDITWSTASEHNTNYFRLDKSRDGTQWDVVNTIGAAGNSNNVIDYALTDFFPTPGINYYRLTQYDNDGAFETFDAQAAVCKDNQFGNTISTYPNPSSSDFNIDLQTDELEGEATLLITDAKGAIVHSQDIKIIKGNNNFVIQKFNSEPGMYYITVKAGTSSVTTKHSVR
jgi:hypothetical protein